MIRIVLDAKDNVGNVFVKTERIIKETKTTYTLREISALCAEDDDDQFDHELRKSEYNFNEISYSYTSLDEDYPSLAIYWGIIEDQNSDIAALIEDVIAEMKRSLIKQFEDHIKMVQSRLDMIKN